MDRSLRLPLGRSDDEMILAYCGETRHRKATAALGLWAERYLGNRGPNLSLALFGKLDDTCVERWEQ